MSFLVSPSINHARPPVKKLSGSFEKFFLSVLSSVFSSPIISNFYDLDPFSLFFRVFSSVFLNFLILAMCRLSFLFSNNHESVIDCLLACRKFVSQCLCE